MNGRKISLCKKLQYVILDNKKLDWLKRERSWKLDRVDAYVGIILLSIFLLTSLFGKVMVLPMMIFFYTGMLLFEIRHIKSVPADIECQFTSKFRCMGFVFIVILLVITIFVAIDRLIKIF